MTHRAADPMLSQKANAISTLPNPIIMTDLSSQLRTGGNRRKTIEKGRRLYARGPCCVCKSSKDYSHTSRPQALLKKRKLKKKKKAKRFW
jgi:hypothetical protein